MAVQVLPAHIATRDDLKARFEREARAVASLNHPNICTLFDIGNQDGVSFMVMELLEGETLAARIERGPIAVDSAVALARQIADALDRAHRAGVTHRDVKPGNIMITRDGVKVLDFGLAKATASASAPDDKTMSAVLTTEGTVLGTPQYMAPEQFEGREADARCDIWAFGAVLHEMVTGQKAFQGKTYSSLVGAILSAEPAPMAVKPFTPRWLERLVLRCLSKDPEDRYQSMRDVVLDLKGVPEEPAARTKPSWSGWAAAGVFAAIALAGWLWHRDAKPTTTARQDFVVPAGTQFTDFDNSGGLAISPDGTTLAFVANDEKAPPQLYLRRLDSFEAKPVPGTEDAGRPFWSPDSRSVGFFAGGKLKRVDVAGGAPEDICDARRARGAHWTDRGEVIFSDGASKLSIVPAAGGKPKLILERSRERGDVFLYYPQVLPGGKQFLYLSRNAREEAHGLYVAWMDGIKPPVQILKTGFSGFYDAASGYLLYMQNPGTLLAKKLELEPPRLTGEAHMIAEDVRTAVGNGYLGVTASRNGTLSFIRGDDRLPDRLWLLDRSGAKLKPLTEPYRGGSFFSMAPDGQRLAYERSTLGPDVYVLQMSTGAASRVSRNFGTTPMFSLDGRYVYYICQPEHACRANADGTGDEQQLAGLPEANRVITSISKDGKYLMTGSAGLSLLATEGKHELTPYLTTTGTEGYGVFSPDGKWVAYQSAETGRMEIYLQSYPDKGQRLQVSSTGGTSPVWRPDGKELFWYAGKEGMVKAVSISPSAGGLKVGTPDGLFELRGTRPRLLPMADGKQFIVLLREGDDKPAKPLGLILNWAAGLAK